MFRSRSVVWLFQISNEQRRVAIFQAQSEGLGRFVSVSKTLAALAGQALAYLEQPNRSPSALL